MAVILIQFVFAVYGETHALLLRLFEAMRGLSRLKTDNTLYELGCREIELAIDIYIHHSIRRNSHADH